jgi:EmrB/QacA subfamily drug resistance transporter
MQPTVQAETPRRGLPYKWIVAIVVIFGAFMTILDQTIVNIALPRLENAFGASLDDVQWVLTAYILVQGITTPTTAFFVDLWGTRRFYLIALATFTVGSALCGLAWSLPVLIIFRIFQGIGGAFLFPLASTLLFSEFPTEERGVASAFIGIAALLAPALGPTLGGYIVTYADWPLIFYINIPFGIIGLILAYILLRDTRSNRRTQFDAIGFSMAAIGLAALLYAFSDASTDGWNSPKIIALLIIGTLVMIGFVFIELYRSRHEQSVLVNLRLFTNGPFLTSNITNALITFGFFGGLFLFPIYLQNLRGLNAFQAGLMLLPQAIASIIASLLVGRVVDRLGAKVVIIPGAILFTLATWLCTSLTVDTAYSWIAVIYIIRGIALGMIIQPLNVSALSDIGPRQIAQASSLFTVIRFIATSLGIAVLATLVQSQAKVHYAHLAERVTQGSSFGLLLTRIQNYLLAHGYDQARAQAASYAQVIELVTRQGYMLAIQDAFWVTLPIMIVAVIAAIFIRGKRKQSVSTVEGQEGLSAEEDAIRREAMIAG